MSVKTLYHDGFITDVADLNNTSENIYALMTEALSLLVKRSGIASGLTVSQPNVGSGELEISAGLAIDKNRMLINMPLAQTLSITSADINKYVTISYSIFNSRPIAHPVTGISENTRQYDFYTLELRSAPFDTSLYIPLCKITGYSNGNITWNESERQFCYLRVDEEHLPSKVIPESKIDFDETAGHTHSGSDNNGNQIDFNHLKNIPIGVDPSIAERQLHASGIIDNYTSAILTPTISAVDNAVYFNPLPTQSNPVYVYGRDFYKDGPNILRSYNASPLPDPVLPGVWYKFFTAISAGYYLIYIDGADSAYPGILKAEPVSIDYKRKDSRYYPLCIVKIDAMGNIDSSVLIDLREFGSINEQVQQKSFKDNFANKLLFASETRHLDSLTSGENLIQFNPDFESGIFLTNATYNIKVAESGTYSFWAKVTIDVNVVGNYSLYFKCNGIQYGLKTATVVSTGLVQIEIAANITLTAIDLVDVYLDAPFGFSGASLFGGYLKVCGPAIINESLPTTVACEVKLSSNQTLTGSIVETVHFSDILIDTRNAFNPTTYSYVIPEDGFYAITVSLVGEIGNIRYKGFTCLNKNGSRFITFQLFYLPEFVSYIGLIASFVAQSYFVAGDVLSIGILCDDPDVLYIANENGESRLCIVKIG